MGFPYTDHLDDNGQKKTIFKCPDCQSHYFTSSNIVSDNFHGKDGGAYLIDKVVNTKQGELEKRHMLTGTYTVCDTLCRICNKYIGWQYLTAEDQSEKYKEQKHVIETSCITAVGVDKRKELY